MKLNYTILFSLLLVPLVHAEDFFAHTGGDAEGYYPANGAQAIMVNLDADPALEVYGGDAVMQLTTMPPVRTLLPEPSRAPYNTASPITWGENCGDVADVDLDGDMDIIRQCRLQYNYTTEPRWRIQVLKNNGVGGFTAGWVWAIDNPGGNLYPGESLSMGDFDADGDADMLMSSTGGVGIRWNAGHGLATFDSILTLSSGYSLLNSIVADFDNDGLQDIVALVHDPAASVPRLVLYTNGGANGGQPGVFVSSIIATLTYSITYQLKAVDVNVDGRTDFLFRQTGTTSGKVTWYRNNGAGFDAPINLYNSGSVRCFNMGMADVNEDGLHDLILAIDDATPKGTLYQYQGITPGTFSTASYIYPVYLESQGYLPRMLCTGDVDSDGDNDIALYSDVPTLIRNGAVHHRAMVQNTVYSGTAPTGATDLAVADVNRDGELDLIAASSGDNKLYWYSTTSGVLGTPVSFSTGNRVPSGIMPGDFDGDGDVDLAYTVPASTEVRMARNINASGIFQDVFLAAVANATRAYADDVNRDGKLDFLVASTATNSVRWFINGGTGISFTQETVAAGMANCQALPMETYSNGRPEVLVFGTSTSGPNYLRSYRRGTSSWIVDQENTIIPTVLAVGDVNNDKKTDAIYADATNKISFWAFAGSATYVIGQMPGTVNAIEMVDWNKDGRCDVLCAYNGGVQLLLNGISGWQTISFATAGNYTELAIIDIDHDSLLDAVGVNQSNGRLHIFKNISWQVRMTHTSMADESGRARIKAGQSGKALRFTAEHGAGQNFGTGDSGIITSNARLRFLKAVPSGQNYVPGAALTDAEVQAVVATVQLIDSDGNVRAAVPPDLDAGGYFTYNLLTHIQYSDQVRDYDLHLAMTPTANTAANAIFFVQHIANDISMAHTTWRPTGGGADTRPLRQTSDVTIYSSLVQATSSTLTALETWRQAQFGTYQAAGDSANEADPDLDGLSNLVEYVMGRDPNSAAGIGSNIAVELIYNGKASQLQAELRLIDTYDSKVKLTLQRTTDLQNWTTLSTRTGTAAWTVTVPTANPIQAGRTRFTFNSGAIPNTTPRFWLRLKAEELAP